MEATYFLDKATMVAARRAGHGSRTRWATASVLIVGGVSLLLVVFGLGTATTGTFILMATYVGLGLRYDLPMPLGRPLNQATDGAGEKWITLTIRPDGLQVSDAFMVSVVGWQHLTRYRKGDDYLLLTARGRHDVIVPRYKLPPFFETNLDWFLKENKTSAERPEASPSLLLHGLQAMVVLSLIFLLLCVVVVVAAGGPKRDRIGTCPDGQIAIVARDADGSIATLCQYRLDS